jgi:hypothetical protein
LPLRILLRFRLTAPLRLSSKLGSVVGEGYRLIS